MHFSLHPLANVHRTTTTHNTSNKPLKANLKQRFVPAAVGEMALFGAFSVQFSSCGRLRVFQKRWECGQKTRDFQVVS
jgi:hypothetical protein